MLDKYHVDDYVDTLKQRIASLENLRDAAAEDHDYEYSRSLTGEIAGLQYALDRFTEELRKNG